MNRNLQGCGKFCFPPVFKFTSQAGFTYFRLMIGLLILSMLMAVGLKTVQPFRNRADLFQTKHDIRKFQEAMILYQAEYERIPTKEELFQTYLKGKDNLSFLIADATEPGSLGFDDEDDSLEEKLYDAVHLIQAENCTHTPNKWLIVTKTNLKPQAQMVFVVDDAVPVVVDGDGQPIGETQELAGLTDF